MVTDQIRRILRIQDIESQGADADSFGEQPAVGDSGIRCGMDPMPDNNMDPMASSEPEMEAEMGEGTAGSGGDTGTGEESGGDAEASEDDDDGCSVGAGPGTNHSGAALWLMAGVFALLWQRRR